MNNANQQPSTFARIVDKLRFMDEAELKLAYMKLFKKEIEEEWTRITSDANFGDTTDEEIVAAIQRKHYANPEGF